MAATIERYCAKASSIRRPIRRRIKVTGAQTILFLAGQVAYDDKGNPATAATSWRRRAPSSRPSRRRSRRAAAPCSHRQDQHVSHRHPPPRPSSSPVREEFFGKKGPASTLVGVDRARAARLAHRSRSHRGGLTVTCTQRHPHPDPLPLRGRGNSIHPLAPGGGEGQGEAERLERARVNVNPFIFRAYDVRGKVGIDITPDVFDRGRPRLRHARPPPGGRSVALGMDNRITSPPLKEAFGRGRPLDRRGRGGHRRQPHAAALLRRRALEARRRRHRDGQPQPRLRQRREDGACRRGAADRRRDPGPPRHDPRRRLRAGPRAARTARAPREEYFDAITSGSPSARASRSWWTPATASRASSRPSCCGAWAARSSSSTASPTATFPNHLPDPEMEENTRDLVAKVLETARGHRHRLRRRCRPHGGGRRARTAPRGRPDPGPPRPRSPRRAIRARESSSTSSAPRRSSTTCAPTAASPSCGRRGTRTSSARCGTTRSCSAARSPGTCSSARTGTAWTTASSPRASSSS